VQLLSVISYWTGKIATAVAAGLLPEDAINAAFFCGQASKDMANSSSDDGGGGSGSMGMMAIGLGGIAVQEFINETSGAHNVHVTCYNSLASVTLSGNVAALEEVKASQQQSIEFAHLLRVDLANHSPGMEHIAKHYELLLRQNGVAAASAPTTANDADDTDDNACQAGVA
jgi:zearalenone synthase (highly reducing iterative type I polyketide synthase)